MAHVVDAPPEVEEEVDAARAVAVALHERPVSPFDALPAPPAPPQPLLADVLLGPPEAVLQGAVELFQGVTGPLLPPPLEVAAWLARV